MEVIHNLVDFPSPTSSLHYVYGDADLYQDTNTSESHSSATSPPYDMTCTPDPSGNMPNVYPSPEQEEEASSPPQAGQDQKPMKRKRENRYKNAPPSVLSRRRAQNRASQRAYRERKDQRIRDLEQMLNEAKQRNDVLGQAYAALHAEYVQLRASSSSSSSSQTPPLGAGSGSHPHPHSQLQQQQQQQQQQQHQQHQQHHAHAHAHAHPHAHPHAPTHKTHAAPGPYSPVAEMGAYHPGFGDGLAPGHHDNRFDMNMYVYADMGQNYSL